MMKRLIVLLWLLVTLNNADLLSQSRAEIKNNFYDAESWILFEAYKDALPLYQQLSNRYPDNSNFKYRIGQCYINTPGDKAKSIRYFEDAVKNINPNYKEGKFRETGAPYDALYYLANAYRINNQLDKALETYALFKKNMDTEVYDTTIVDLQIQSCLNAKDLMKSPNYVKEENLGNIINESNSEFNPVVSDNEDLLVFSKSEPFYDAILYSKKVNRRWTEPQNMNELLKVDRDLSPTSISSDGKTLYLYSSADYDGIIYSSSFETGVWSPMVKLNENINTKYWESHASISHDNKKLYFTSNRKGTYGGLDIYVASRDSTGDWGAAENLGPVINSPYNEESPFLSKDDKTLFFSSRGHYNIGGYDIFYSTQLENGEWSAPVNIGYPLNTTDDDLFFKPVNEGYQGYYSMESPDGFGRQDIYRIETFSDKNPRRFIVRGVARVADLREDFRDSIKITFLNVENPDKALAVFSNSKTGEFEFHSPQGNYKILYEGFGAEKVTGNVTLPFTNPYDTILLPKAVLPRTDFYADLRVEGKRSISVVNGDPILFHLKVEPNSSLIIENWSGESKQSVEQSTINDSTFIYRMIPKTGYNKIVFNLADRFNNSAATQVFITRKDRMSTPALIRPEYDSVIAKKQMISFLAMLKNRADDQLLKIITDSGIENQQFGTIDDMLSYLKIEAAKKNISTEDVDKLALKVAFMDNVLTQASVDMMAKYTSGELKEFLSGLNIYKSNIKSWTDLQTYISLKTEDRITPQELNNIAETILSEIDPKISVLRDKILAFSEKSETGAVLNKSVTTIDQGKITLREKWLNTFYNESIKQGLTPGQLSEMFVLISTLPDTKLEQFKSDLIGCSEEPLLLSLKSVDLKKEKIKSPKDLVLFLLTSEDQNKYPEEYLFKAIANLIISKDIPEDVIKSQLPLSEGNRLWILWIIIGSTLIFLFIIFRKRKEKNKE